MTLTNEVAHVCTYIYTHVCAQNAARLAVRLRLVQLSFQAEESSLNIFSSRRDVFHFL